MLLRRKQFHVCSAYRHGHGQTPGFWRSQERRQLCLLQALFYCLLFWEVVSCRSSPASALWERWRPASCFHLSPDAFSLLSSLLWAGLCFCTRFSCVEERATGVVEDQGVAVLGMMWLFLGLSLIIVQPSEGRPKGPLAGAWAWMWTECCSLLVGCLGWLDSLSREWSADLPQAGCSVDTLSYSGLAGSKFTVQFGMGTFNHMFSFRLWLRVGNLQSPVTLPNPFKPPTFSGMS